MLHQRPLCLVGGCQADLAIFFTSIVVHWKEKKKIWTVYFGNQGFSNRGKPKAFPPRQKVSRQNVTWSKYVCCSGTYRHNDAILCLKKRGKEVTLSSSSSLLGMW